MSRTDAATAGPKRADLPPAGSTPLFSFGPWLWATLGVLLAALAAMSGVGLVFFYQPASSVESLVDLEQATGFGFLRDLHYWAANGLLLAAWLHLARVFAAGSYRRRLGWRVTVALVAVVTVQTWLGDRLAGPCQAGPLQAGTSQAAFAAHVLIMPVVLAVLVAVWQRRRSGAPEAASSGAQVVADPAEPEREEGPEPKAEERAEAEP